MRSGVLVCLLLPAVAALSVPSTNLAKQQQLLLQSKRPIGRRQLGQPASLWLRDEMRVKADAFIAEVLFADPTNDRQEKLTGRILAETFSPQQLEAHLQQRLDESGLEPGEERLAHELAAQHAPTLWAAFVVSVQTVLQKRVTNDTLADMTDWRVFLHTQHHAKPSAPAQRETKPSGARKGSPSRSDSARARDGARRASMRPASDPRVVTSTVNRQPYGKQALGGRAVAWLRGAGAVCADEYCALVAGARAEQLSGLVDVLGPGQAGTHAVLSALNTEEAVSEAAVSTAAALLSSRSLEEYREAFDRIDTDGSGDIDAEEVEALLRDVYGEEASPEGMAAFLANFNADKDGVISWEVFAAALGDMENEDASAEADDMDPEATRDGGMAIDPDSVLLGGARASPPAGWIVAHEIDAGGEAASEGGEAWERLLSEAILAEARPRFGVLPLARRFNAELVFSCGAQPPLAWTGLESLELRGHVPTLWSVFIRAVRLKLQAELGPQWSVSTEWRVLQALYAEASAAPGMRWQLPSDAARQEAVVGKVVPKRERQQQRRPSSRREPQKVGVSSV